jgi:hypothetical protein
MGLGERISIFGEEYGAKEGGGTMTPGFPPGRLTEVAGYFFRLGITAFGGPAAHIAMMHSEVVKRRRWLDDQRFLDLLGATNLIPALSLRPWAFFCPRSSSSPGPSLSFPACAAPARPAVRWTGSTSLRWD